MSPGPKAVRITPVKTDGATLLSVVLQQTKQVVEVTLGFYEKVILIMLIVINIVIHLFHCTTKSNVNDSEDHRFTCCDLDMPDVAL